MKYLILTFVILFSLNFACFGQNIGINDNNSEPKASAMLDVYSTTKGMLIPRVTLTSTTSASPVTSPETSLLVYNTATTNDVTPGYYYWDAGWVRLKASGESQVPVAKSESVLLLKSENNIIASGDIILTLPVVTNADNGLEISVTNIGTHTDLVVIKPETDKKIDACDSSMLTRWVGKTFRAYESNWIEVNKEPLTDNLLEVCESCSFTTIPEVVEFLVAHMSAPTLVRIGGGTYSITAPQTIDLPFPVTFQGLSFGNTIITCPDDGSAAFEANTECYFKMLDFRAGSTPGIAIILSGDGEYYEIKDHVFSGFTKAIFLSAGVDAWVFETDFQNCTTAGIEVDAGPSNDVILKASESDFNDCAIGLNLISGGPLSEIAFLSGTFYNTDSQQIGINYLPTTGTDNFRFTSFIVQNNSFNSIGMFASGFDFSRSDGRDAEVFMENNAGVSSKKPHTKIKVANSTSITTITTANTWYKAADFTNYSSFSTKFTNENNKVTYQPIGSRDVMAFISGNIKCNNTSRTINFAIVKDGISTTRYGESSVRITAANQPFQFSTNVYLPDLSQGEYLEIWVTSSNNGDILTIDDLNWWIDAH